MISGMIGIKGIRCTHIKVYTTEKGGKNCVST